MNQIRTSLDNGQHHAKLLARVSEANKNRTSACQSMQLPQHQQQDQYASNTTASGTALKALEDNNI